MEHITTSLKGVIVVLLGNKHMRKEVLDKIWYTWKQEVNEVFRESVSTINIDEK